MSETQKQRMYLSVAGKIYNEISTNVPSTTFAMTEIIKNAYEAGASYIDIAVGSDRIEIIDDGSGMQLEDIHNLLILSHSKKEYGSIINGRICSGEKGLGFFSVFKFGKKVTVTTNSNGFEHQFIIDMSSIIQLKDIRDYSVDIHSKESLVKELHGTRILIEDLDIESMILFKESLENSTKLLRLQNVIHSSEFKINIRRLWKNENDNLLCTISHKIENEKLLATAEFDSNRNKGNKNFFYTIRLNDGTTSDVEIDEKFKPLLEKNNFSLNFELSFYSFKPGDIKKISDFYKINTSQIAPVVYFNDVLFDNNNLYNVEINTHRSSKLVIRQQIGKINIYLLEKDILKFNSDRSQVMESTNKRILCEFLDFISSTSQIKIKELLEKSIPRVIKKNIYQNDDPQNIGISVDTQFIEILFNNDLRTQFTSSEVGVWRLKCENGDVFEVNVVEIPNPKIELRVDKLYLAKEYQFMEIFSFSDYQGTQRIKPISFKVHPEENIIKDDKKRTLTVTAGGEVEFEIVIEDKISGKKSRFKQNVQCVSQPLPPIKRSKDDFIKPLISNNIVSHTEVNHDTANLIDEFNIAHSKGDYPLLRCASSRLVIELICCDILDKIGIDKKIELLQNIKNIFKAEVIQANFFDKISDERDRRGIQAIFDKINDKDFLSKAIFLGDFNISTHSGIRLQEEDFYNEYRNLYDLLYSYLLIVSATNK